MNKPAHGGYPDLGDPHSVSTVCQLFKYKDHVTVMSDGGWKGKHGMIEKVIPRPDKYYGWEYRVLIFSSNQAFNFIQTELTRKV